MIMFFSAVWKRIVLGDFYTIISISTRWKVISQLTTSSSHSMMEFFQLHLLHQTNAAIVWHIFMLHPGKEYVYVFILAPLQAMQEFWGRTEREMLIYIFLPADGTSCQTGASRHCFNWCIMYSISRFWKKCFIPILYISLSEFQVPTSFLKNQTQSVRTYAYDSGFKVRKFYTRIYS